MNEMLKQLIKEAILEALVEFVNQSAVATGAEDVPDPESAPETPTDGEDESGKGGASQGSSGGGITDDGRPRPNVGVGVFNVDKPNVSK